MHPKKWTSLILLIGALSVHSQATGSTRLVPEKNVSIPNRFLFLIDASKTNESAWFSVTVAPNAKAPSPPFEAWLMLSDGTNEIVRHPLKNVGTEEVYRYQFEVTSKFLTQSQFVVRALEKPSSEESFWFFLKDFLKASDKKKVASVGPGL